MGLFKLRKLYEDSDILICDEIRLIGDGPIKIKNRMGFVKVEITKDGTIKAKGRMEKI